ncbi:hypothetical protein [Bartonella sp. CB74]|uniref:hypothetical protein n=1 Tax=Bartonella sp. CB74 TaxID=3113620 RepID=UPI002F96E904
MNFKCDKKLLVRIVPRSILIVLLLAMLCVFLICLYYAAQPRGYRASLTFSLSDSMGKPLAIDQQNNITALLLLQPVILNDSNLQNFFLEGFYKKNFRENIRLFRNGNLISFAFEAGTIESAQQGLKTWFSTFSKAIVKQNQKLLLIEPQVDQQYDNAAILNIVQEFRSSVASFIHQDAKKTELNDLYMQLTGATLKRIHLTSLNSAIKMMRENGQSLLSLSFIASNSAIAALESKRNLLETQKAHMTAQLGWTHPQIKALIAESEALSRQLENKILQITDQIHVDEVIARDFEKQLKERISFFIKDHSQSLSQIFNELEDKIRAIVEAQNKITSKSSSLQNIKIQVVVPATLMPISFITLYGKSIIVSIFTSLIILLGGLLLFQQYFQTKKSQSEENSFESGKGSLVSKGIKGLETFITIEGLSNFLKWRTSTVVSIIGPESARMAAKLSLHLTKEQKTILLVDISGQEIEKVIGPHRGLSDILMGNAQLQDVVYRDYDTGIDILPQGLKNIAYVQDFSNSIPNILQEFKKDYDFVILEIASEPKYGFKQFAELTDYYICSVALSEQNWMMQMVNSFPKTVYRIITS